MNQAAAGAAAASSSCCCCHRLLLDTCSCAASHSHSLSLSFSHSLSFCFPSCGHTFCIALERAGDTLELGSDPCLAKWQVASGKWWWQLANWQLAAAVVAKVHPCIIPCPLPELWHHYHPGTAPVIAVTVFPADCCPRSGRNGSLSGIKLHKERERE